MAAPRLGGALARFATAADAPQTPSPTTGGHEQQPHFRQRKSTLAKKSRTKTQDPALALFADVVNADESSGPGGGELAARPVVTELELIAKINFVKRGTDIVKDYDVFRREIWPHIEKMPQIPKTVYEATTDMLARVRSNLSWVQGPQGPKAIALEVAQMFSVIGRQDLNNRHDIVVNLCYTLIDKTHPTSRRRVLMTDLIGLWQHISQLRRRGEAGKELRFALPTDQDVIKDLGKIKGLTVKEEASPGTIKRALTSLFTLFPPTHAEAILPGLLATVAFLSDKRYSNKTAQIEAAPLLHLVQLVLTRVPGGLTPEAVDAIFLKRNSGVWAKQQKLRGYVINQLPEITKLLLYESDNWQSGVRKRADPEMDGVVRLSTFHKQLRQAYWARNTGAILSIWQNLMTALQNHPQLADDIRYDPHFLDFWVFVWCGVRRGSKLQETMNLMQELEIEPTLKTYTSMMHGWKMAKETDKIEALWSQLLQSGLKLDVIIWTERISSLIDGGHPEQAIEELKHMVAAWKKGVASGKEEECVEPTIAVVNAVLKGLLRHGDAQKANAILGWAGKEGFSPDVRTYNILLRETLRGDQSGDAKTLLQSMKQAGIDPDSATFTILLEGVLGRMGPDVKPKEQMEAIEAVFGEFRASGIKPGLETYGKMLYAVARLSGGSDAAIAAVLEHMRRAGFQITVYMVTILIERALDQRTPDIAKVRQLLREHKLDDIAQGDQTLWERVMSAYAVAGHRDDAVALFDKLEKAGRPVTSLPCLTDLLRTLLAGGEGETAKRVVKVVWENQMKRQEQSNERYWKHHFWHLASESGLLKGLDVPHRL